MDMSPLRKERQVLRTAGWFSRHRRWVFVGIGCRSKMEKLEKSMLLFTDGSGSALLLWDWRGPARDGAGRDPCSLHFCISTWRGPLKPLPFSLHTLFARLINRF